jgi:vancomycin resistance protein YoaR
VTCPRCHESFEVDAGGVLAPARADKARSRALAQQPDAQADERSVAREVLDDLAVRLGEQLAAAAREARLFRDYGRELLEAFDDYRLRAGQQAGAEAFREELRRRWRVELSAVAEARS